MIVLLGLFVLSFASLVHKFYTDNTILAAKNGGTYIEGSVGKLAPLNPWFAVTNDVNRDIVSLVFAGLLKYNPKTKNIEPDLATLNISEDTKTYTLTLKENLFWHDSTERDPHPVTADDVLFTFQTIQDPDFPNTILQQNFRGVHIEKIDDRTARFTLDQPYSFFPSNLTMGLLPKRSFEGIPPGKLDQALDFAFAPIGAGPYKIKSVVETDLSTEVTLEKFSRSIQPYYQLDRVVFRIFPDYSTLLSDMHNLGGVRTVPRSADGRLLVPKHFIAETYTLPQYVALFFNLDHAVLKDDKLRLGLQLGTNKQEIIDTIHEQKIVDTPLLEIDTSDWRYHFDAEAAQGSLYSSRWFVPERLRLQALLEKRDTNAVGVLHIPPVLYLESGATFTLTGSYTNLEQGSHINTAPLQTVATNTGTWILPLSMAAAGVLKSGDNLLRLTDAGGKIVDSHYVYVAPDRETYGRALVEQQLLQLFLDSKDGKVPKNNQILMQNLYLDHGFLRRRQSGDQVSIRRNEKGDLLKLTLLTSPAPEAYKQVASAIQKQWLELGVQVQVIVPATSEEFEQRLLTRDYDVLLFGQSLLDNLDSYPYWHSSGVQKVTGKDKDLRRDAYNLSQYTSFRADSLLETIRRTASDTDRTKALKDLQEMLKKDVPAIFLYSPQYTYAHHEQIQGVHIDAIALHSDRFLTLHQWYVKQQRAFKTGENWLSFFGWLRTLL
ncbi:MAG: peptide/nickel transport system substrate-binding protein [Candidatus Peribacteria bacterium]|nr:peptide/nickel transport system substrate-binding protein [Candidatus Peribacteria bacterium]